jgi:YfiH family protein
MFIEKPEIFKQFPNLVFGLSTKSFQLSGDSFGFNMSKSIGDSNTIVERNRDIFFRKLGLERVVIQKQIHSDIINIVDGFEKNLEGDALITKRTDIGLAISTADCTNIYLYDAVQKIIAAVHSGWAGTEKKILEKTITILQNNFGTESHNIFAYFAPSISQQNYDVGNDFTDKFDSKYLIPNKNKLLLDLKLANKEMLIRSGIPENQIEISNICSYADENLHSYRRDKEKSGRALGVIALKNI